MTRKEHTSLSGCIQDKGVSCNYTSYFVDRRHRIQQRRKVVEQQQQAAELNFSNNNSAAKDTRRVFALSTPGRVVHRLLRLVHRHESMRLNVKPQIPHPVEYINAEPLVVHYGSFIVMYVKAKHLAMEHRCLCNAANQEIDRLNYKTDQVSERKLRDFISYVQDQLQYGKYEIEKVLDTVSDLSIKIDTFGQSFSIVGRMPIICRNIRIAAIFFIQQISARVHGERELLISKIKRILTQKRETKQYSSMHPDACSSWALWALSFVDPKLIAALMNRSISCNRQAII
ncbi:hypothetical protein Ddc_08492 [Ditylenchus destructor]|nr:hypothetical protein Ddc_08492 [Ditylenchus destructor]